MERPLEKFQNLLRDLFQFDCADPDFGIYCIMNHRRAVIERFISEDLPGWLLWPRLKPDVSPLAKTTLSTTEGT